MTLRSTSSHWYRTFWKIVSNPTLEVVAAVVVMLLAAWIVIDTASEEKHQNIPVLFGK